MPSDLLLVLPCQPPNCHVWPREALVVVVVVVVVVDAVVPSSP
jgi:hypothetical protein